MAHRKQIKFVALVRDYFGDIFDGGRILEVGSYVVTSSIRQTLVENNHGVSCRGVDLVPGPGVDYVGSCHAVDFGADHFDLTISCERFEHNPFWRETFSNMFRMTRPGGLVVVTCASSGMLEHGTKRSNPTSSPGTNAIGLDYYKNLSKRDFETALDLNRVFTSRAFVYIPHSCDLHFVGIKTGSIHLNIPPAFVREVMAIKWMRFASLSGRRILQILMIEFPLKVLARLTPESHFRTFGLRYLKLLGPVKRATA